MVSGSSQTGGSRRFGRRQALGIALGVAAALVIGRQSAFAEDAKDETDVSAVPPTDGEDAQGRDDNDNEAEEVAAAPKTYTVQAKDTMFSIAKRHGVSVDAMLWANDLSDANVLKQGQQLVIPSTSGKLHTTKDGDSLESLAKAYGVSKSRIAEVNKLDEDEDDLKTGQRLLIPVKPGNGDPAFAPVPLTAASAEAPVPIPPAGGSGSPTPPLISMIPPVIQLPGSGTAPGVPTGTVRNGKLPKLGWPVSPDAPKSGVSQGFRPGHTGIDIYTPEGTPIKAAAAGTVKMVEKNPDGFSGYGWIIIVDHGDGISTWYAHCGSFAVKAGDKVSAGDKLGTVGMTGRTDGPHLHFELRVAANAVDPRLALA